MTRARSGFTLIEALTVVAIIGILVSLAAYVVTQAQRKARDTKRISDLATIAQGFEARFLDKTCTDQADVGEYPGKELTVGGNGVRPWYPVSDLQGSSVTACNPFSYYLANIPTDTLGVQNRYYFNLSGSSLDAKHYRLAARLERPPSEAQREEICRLSDVWSENFYGQPYDGCGGDTIISKFGRVLLAATLAIGPNPDPNPNPDPDPDPNPDPDPDPDPDPEPDPNPDPNPDPDDIPPPYNYYIGR